MTIIHSASQAASLFHVRVTMRSAASKASGSP